MCFISGSLRKLHDEHHKGALKVLNPHNHVLALEYTVSIEGQDREVRSTPPGVSARKFKNEIVCLSLLYNLYCIVLYIDFV